MILHTSILILINEERLDDEENFVNIQSSLHSKNMDK